MASPETDLLEQLRRIEQALRDAGLQVDDETDLAAAVRELAADRDGLQVELEDVAAERNLWD